MSDTENLVAELRENYDASQLRLHRAEAEIATLTAQLAESEAGHLIQNAQHIIDVDKLRAAEKVCEAAEMMRASSNVTNTTVSRIYADFDLGYVEKFIAFLEEWRRTKEGRTTSKSSGTGASPEQSAKSVESTERPSSYRRTKEGA